MHQNVHNILVLFLIGSNFRMKFIIKIPSDDDIISADCRTFLFDLVYSNDVCKIDLSLFNAQISSFNYIKCAIGFVLSLKYFS